MHELSIAESIIGSLDKLKTQENFKKINSINIEIGHLSGVDIRALRFALDSIKSETMLAEAVVNLIPLPVQVKCNDCGWQGEIEEYMFACKECEGRELEIISGDSITIAELDVD